MSVKEKSTMNIENKVNNVLNNIPFLKKGIKRIYQLGAYAVSSKIKFEGDIKRISPNDGKEYFFGYYDKSPWDSSDRFMLCLRVNKTYEETAPEESAEIVLFDTDNNNKMEIIASTKTWNVQQGAMLQWLGPDFTTKIIYNDFRDDQYCSIILDVNTNEETKISKPIYSVSNDGSFGLSLDFSRLHRLRKGYGYSNKEEATKNEKIPNAPAVWKVDLADGQSSPILSYNDFYSFETRAEMKDAEHKVNHIMINPDNTRFMILHRWTKASRKFTRLITADIDGSNMFNLSDDDMVSHCSWKNNNQILAFARKVKEGNGYFLMNDKSNIYSHLWPELSSDGHPSYSPSNKYVVTDTYPDRSRIAKIYLLKEDKYTIEPLVKVFAPFKYDNDVRCDLHPRWNRKGNKIAFDSVFEGKRGLYVTTP